MDDYLTKPLHPEELIEVVERLGQPGTLEACHQYLPDSSEVFNPQAMWSRVGEDLELLEELIDLFLSDYPQRLTQLQEALSRADYTTLARSAHAMKGALGNMSANAAYTAALTLEARARAGDQPGAASALANLKTELERLQPALTAFIGTKHP
jgi:HPt (histidine-containing phosphotransfer) domain-containing protein